MRLEKKCFRCDERKPLEEFHFQGSKIRSYCKKCCKIIHKETYTPEQKREYHLRSTYNLSQSEWNTIFEVQGNVCKICKSNKPRHIKGWQTDHCHKSRKVRGILCWPCNAMVEWVEYGYPLPTKEQFHTYLTQ